MMSAHENRTLNTLKEAIGANFYENGKDLHFKCSGVSLTYHQSVLSFHSKFLADLLGSFSCCSCKKAKCGRKEEVVVILDKTEATTLQILMDYLYKGECFVDTKTYRLLQDLVYMLGIDTKLQLKEEHISNNGISMSEQDKKDSPPSNQKNKHSQGRVKIKQMNDLIKEEYLDKNKAKPKGRKSQTKKKSKEEDSSSKQKTNIKNNAVSDPDKNRPTSSVKRSRTSKRKADEALPLHKDYYDEAGEFICFNPTFKLKAGTKRETKSQSSDKLVPEVRLTFNLDDLSVSPHGAMEVGLPDILPNSSTGKNRTVSLKIPSSVNMNGHDNRSPASKNSILKGKTMFNSEQSQPKNTDINSGIISKLTQAEDSISNDGSVEVPVTTTGRSHKIIQDIGGNLMAMHPSSGLDIKMSEDEKIEDTQEYDVVGKILEDVSSHDVSSDGSEAPLVMDISEQEI